MTQDSMENISSLARATKLLAAGVVVLATVPCLLAQQMGPFLPPAPPAQNACSDCSESFICNDTPGVPGEVIQGWTGFRHWLEDGPNCWKLYNVAVEYQDVALMLCDGTEISVRRNIATYFAASVPENRYCLNDPYPKPGWGWAPEVPGTVVNPPTVAGGAPAGPTSPGPAGPNHGKNCHGATFFPCPFPYPPGTPESPGPSSPLGPNSPPQGGGTEVDNPAGAAVSGASGNFVTECSDEIPAGVIVMVYCSTTGVGPPDPDGNYPFDPSKPTIAIHSAVSNGDGTFKTKNGKNPGNDSASYAEAIETYTNSEPDSNGVVCYPVCLVEGD